MGTLQISSTSDGTKQAFLLTTLLTVSLVLVSCSLSFHYFFIKKAVLHQSRFDSKMLRKKYYKYFTAVIVLLPCTFTAAVFAKEMTGYIKGLGSSLREQPTTVSYTHLTLPTKA